MANLQGIPRDKLGSRYARILRLQGRIPASVQGEGKDNVHLSLDEHEFMAARRHHEHLFDIDLEKGDQETALVRELQWDPFGEHIVHVEFRRVVRGQETTAEVELDFIGHPKGGVLNHLLTHVPIKAIPTLIPDSIEVRVDELEAGHPVLAHDLNLPEGVSLDLPGETQIAMVAALKAEAEAPAAGEEGEEGAAGEESGEAPAPEEKS